MKCLGKLFNKRQELLQIAPNANYLIECLFNISLIRLVNEPIFSHINQNRKLQTIAPFRNAANVVRNVKLHFL